MPDRYKAMTPCRINGRDYQIGEIVPGDGLAAAALKYLTPPVGSTLEPYYGEQFPKEQHDEREAGARREAAGGNTPHGGGAAAGGARPVNPGSGKRG